jgi:signal transduction histidine kinase
MGHRFSSLFRGQRDLGGASGPQRGGPDPLATLEERYALFERLIKIQQSISHGAPLKEVFDAITIGASELTGDSVVGLRLIDPDDPDYCYVAASHGLPEDLVDKFRRSRMGEGAGGRAILENRLVVIEHYSESLDALKVLALDGLQAAMAVPVHEKGEVVGSLVVASYDPGRSFSASEKEALTAFAQHAGLALTDARALETMHEAQRAKDMFLAMTSHGLKTPLTAILGTLVTLEKHHARIDDEQRSRLLSAALARANELGEIIDRLLKGFRAELSSAPQEVMLPDLIGDALSGFGHIRDLKVREVPPTPLHVDADAIQQVLGILLENALSHSPEESPIEVITEEGGGRVAITVRNEGTLPAETEPDRLFEPFHRGGESTSSGVGLGLYIASQLASAVDGSIDVRSHEEVVDFVLSFPHHRSDDPTTSIGSRGHSG